MKIFEILNIPKEQYFLTGSRALDTENYQCSSSGSDYDYFLHIHFRHILLNYLNLERITVEFSCYNGGFKFLYDGKSYNIITGIDIEFHAWKNSLSLLQLLIASDEKYAKVLHNKHYRYSFYEQFRGILKTMQTISYENK
jgi:hypothetical protein